jgi:hypothetical protein
VAEKPTSFEVHPMRGHSRGEWYATQKDIANSDEDADYWALFSVTLRGNKHCVGEFPTKAEALAAQKYARQKVTDD